MSPLQSDGSERARLDADAWVITSASLGNPEFSQLLDAAVGAGCRGLSLWPLEDYQRARDAGGSAAELRRRVADQGLVVHDVDALVRWVGAGDPGWPYLQEAPEALVWEAAAALEVEFVNCILVGEPAVHPEELAAGFRSVCEQADRVGLRVTLEFMSISRVRDLASARRVLELADCANGSLMLDTWHLANCDWPLSELAELPARWVGGIQLSDRSADPTRRHGMRDRLPPGEGVLELGDFYRVLHARGVRVPFTLEVFNSELLETLGPIGAARRHAEAARRNRAESLQRDEGD